MPTCECRACQCSRENRLAILTDFLKRTAPLVSFSNANRKLIVAIVFPLWVTGVVVFLAEDEGNEQR